MRSHRMRALACVTVALALVVASCSSQPKTQAPSPSPSSPVNVSLDGWQLTLPVADPSSGGADTVNPARISPPWLTQTDSGVMFWAPVEGATTPNSSHARTELVSKDSFSGGKEPRTLTASLAVTQLPSENPDVIIGQIHGAGDIKSVPYVMLHYFDGAIKVVVKQAQTGDASMTYPLADDVPLSTPFTFRISDDGNGSLTFALDAGGRTTTATAPVPAAFSGADVRFQVGAYQQAKSTGDTAADDGARVTFTTIATNKEAGAASATPTP
ncbi:MAG: polysaccharide lyase family 7 protein [Pseudonocardiales bacterium]|nr:polysaccharide lyase family 7 protein [Pseudonocardiales bacterium]